MHSSNNFDVIFEQIKTNMLPFIGVFFAVVFFTYGFLYLIDFIPEPVESELEESQNTNSFGFFEVIKTVWGSGDETSMIVDAGRSVSDSVMRDTNEGGIDATPNKMIIESLDKEVAILNPTSSTVYALDKALLQGIVRHPESADLTNDGNMLIIGHSSYLPNVFNKNFQALNGIQNLTWGDVIRIESDDAEYVYRVDRVYAAKATELVVPNDWGEAKLTLATCNTFGAKEDRFIVEAVLVEKNVL